MPRPQRLQVTDELGRRRTLPEGLRQFEALRAPPLPASVVFLGLGPEPAEAVKLAAGMGRVRYLECPDFLAQAPPGWADALPPDWEALRPEDLPTIYKDNPAVFAYAPGLRLFSCFWGPLAAEARARGLGLPTAGAGRTVVLPGGEGALLLRELAEAFRGHGYRVLRLPEAEVAARLPRLLRDERPALLFSINLAGLDPWGERFELCRAVGCRVALWMVDNPWHLLTAVKSPWWREADLFVTDHSFLPTLKAHGAGSVFHAPLAAWPGFAAGVAAHNDPGLAGAAVFVGRSAFPDKRKFFSGLTLPGEAWAEAEALLQDDGRPDFAWWTRRLGITELWPGNAVRLAGLGAEESARLRRTLVLRAAARTLGPGGLVIYGDAAWRELVPDAEVREPVDYYGPLAAIYAGARAVLNVTSLLLPAGLTQRHFDVPLVGGRLLTDRTAGLDIFGPEALAGAVFDAPSGKGGAGVVAEGLTARLDAPPDPEPWRAEVLARHSYGRRVAAMLAAMGLEAAD